MPIASADSTLAAIIRAVESNANYGAVRFEPGIYADSIYPPEAMDKCALLNRCTMQTAKVLCSMSFGAYQIMGFNLYGSLAITTNVAQFFESESYQDVIFSKFLLQKNINYSWNEMKTDATKMAQFAKVYNGSTTYAQTMMAAAQRLGDV